MDHWHDIHHAKESAEIITSIASGKAYAQNGHAYMSAILFSPSYVIHDIFHAIRPTSHTVSDLHVSLFRCRV